MSRWIRLDTTWDQSEWLVELTPAQRLCWVALLCYVKAHGIDGMVKRVSPALFAQRYVTGVTRNDVTVFEEAAILGGALAIEDGQWVVTGWKKYQGDPTAPERMKRYRAEKSRLSPLRNATESDVTHRRVTPTETETKTETKEPPTTSGEVVPPQGDRATPLGDFLEGGSEGLKLFQTRRDYHLSQEVRILMDFVTGPTADQRWRRPDGGKVAPGDRPPILDAALADYGADGTRWNAVAFRAFVDRAIRSHTDEAKPRGSQPDTLLMTDDEYKAFLAKERSHDA